MAAGEYDLTESGLNARLFGPQPPQNPLDLPGVVGRDHFRTIFEQEGQSNASVNQKAPDGLTDSERRIKNALFADLVKYARGTNVTASLPMHTKPGLWSDPIDLSATFADPGTVMTDYMSVVSFIVPAGRWARFDGYGVDVSGGYTYDGSLLWRITRNGLDVPTLAGWGEHRGTIAIPRKTFIVAPQDILVSFDVQRVIAGAACNVAMALKGWTWRLRMNYEGTKASVATF